MEKDNIKILLVEDNPGDAALIRETLREAQAVHFDLTMAERLTEALQHLSTESTDIILLDLSLPDGHGLESVQRVHDAAPQVPIVVLTGLNDEVLAVQAVQQGAQDYLVKGQLDGGLLVRALRYAIERAQIQQALAASERKLRLLAANIRDTVLAYDLNGHLQYVNPAFEILTGYPLPELYERDFLTYIHPEDKSVLRQLWQDLFAGQGFTDIEHRIVTKNGEIKWCASSGSPAHDESGTRVGVQCRIADITARRMAETALMESEERFRTVVSFMREGILLINREGAVQFSNKNAENLLGLNAAQLQRRSPMQPDWRIIAEDGSELLREQYPHLTVLSTGEAQHNTTIGIHRPGEEISWLAVNVTPLFRPREKQPYAVLATFTAKGS